MAILDPDCGQRFAVCDGACRPGCGAGRFVPVCHRAGLLVQDDWKLLVVRLDPCLLEWPDDDTVVITTRIVERVAKLAKSFGLEWFDDDTIAIATRIVERVAKLAKSFGLEWFDDDTITIATRIVEQVAKLAKSFGRNRRPKVL